MEIRRLETFQLILYYLFADIASWLAPYFHILVILTFFPFLNFCQFLVAHYGALRTGGFIHIVVLQVGCISWLHKDSDGRIFWSHLRCRYYPFWLHTVVADSGCTRGLHKALDAYCGFTGWSHIMVA